MVHYPSSFRTHPSPYDISYIQRRGKKSSISSDGSQRQKKPHQGETILHNSEFCEYIAITQQYQRFSFQGGKNSLSLHYENICANLTFPQYKQCESPSADLEFRKKARTSTPCQKKKDNVVLIRKQASRRRRLKRLELSGFHWEV